MRSSGGFVYLGVPAFRGIGEEDGMGKVKVAVIGAGIWGKAHLEAYTEHPAAELAAVCDTDEGRAREAAERFAIPHRYADVSEMLAGEELDAVSVVTPDALHADVTIRCAEAGLHVLCEKPLATTIEDCEAMITAARQNDVHLMVDWHNRWNPPFYAAWEAARNGELGDVRYIYYRLSDTIYVPTKMLPWASDSSVMMFLGSHSIDTACWLMGANVRSVTCRRQEGVLTGMGIDTADLYVTLLDFDNGAVAVIENSWILPQSAPALVDHRAEIIGSKGVVHLDPQYNGAITKYTERTPEGFPELSMPDMFGGPRVQGKQVGFASRSIDHFVECIRDGKTPITSGNDGLINTRIILAAEESAARGGVPVRI